MASLVRSGATRPAPLQMPPSPALGAVSAVQAVGHSGNGSGSGAGAARLGNAQVHTTQPSRPAVVGTRPATNNDASKQQQQQQQQQHSRPIASSVAASQQSPAAHHAAGAAAIAASSSAAAPALLSASIAAQESSIMQALQAQNPAPLRAALTELHTLRADISRLEQEKALRRDLQRQLGLPPLSPHAGGHHKHTASMPHMPSAFTSGLTVSLTAPTAAVASSHSATTSPAAKPQGLALLKAKAKAKALEAAQEQQQQHAEEKVHDDEFTWSGQARRAQREKAHGSDDAAHTDDDGGHASNHVSRSHKGRSSRWGRRRRLKKHREPQVELPAGPYFSRLGQLDQSHDSIATSEGPTDTEDGSRTRGASQTRAPEANDAETKPQSDARRLTSKLRSKGRHPLGLWNALDSEDGGDHTPVHKSSSTPASPPLAPLSAPAVSHASLNHSASGSSLLTTPLPAAIGSSLPQLRSHMLKRQPPATMPRLTSDTLTSSAQQSSSSFNGRSLGQSKSTHALQSSGMMLPSSQASGIGGHAEAAAAHRHFSPVRPSRLQQSFEGSHRSLPNTVQQQAPPQQALAYAVPQRRLPTG